MRDKYATLGDPACYPGTDVLINRLDIRDSGLLAEAEAEFAATAADNIEITAPPFNLTYLCHLHRQLFDEVYEWAGQIRSVDIAKGQTRFCTCMRIVPEAQKIFTQLSAEESLRRLVRAELTKRAAEIYGELNIIHPFREGNGRALRLFFEHLILCCGYAVSWRETGQEEWIKACIAAVSCDYAPLTAIFDRCIGQSLA